MVEDTVSLCHSQHPGDFVYPDKKLYYHGLRPSQYNGGQLSVVTTLILQSCYYNVNTQCMRQTQQHMCHLPCVNLMPRLMGPALKNISKKNKLFFRGVLNATRDLEV